LVFIKKLIFIKKEIAENCQAADANWREKCVDCSTRQQQSSNTVLFPRLSTLVLAQTPPVPAKTSAIMTATTSIMTKTVPVAPKQQ
jgi:hypothetical protein